MVRSRWSQGFRLPYGPFRKKTENALRRLERFPDSGKRIRESPALPFRELVIPPYRFFYRVDRKTIWVVALWHGAQLPRSPDE